MPLASMLHPPLDLTQEDAADALARLEELHRARGKTAAAMLRNANDPEMPVSVDTVSLTGNFDGFVGVYLSDGTFAATCILDSGCPVLVMPDFELFNGTPGYTVLGQANEPFGLPAAIVEGPICLAGPEGLVLLGNVIFYACTQASPTGSRTANFGCGLLNPLTNNPMTQPLGTFTVPSPVANSGFRYLNVRFGAASSIFSPTGDMMVASTSTVVVSFQPPSAQTIYFNIIQNFAWMALPTLGVAIGGPDYSAWPGQWAPALIDTGGGPVFVNDPNGCLYTQTLPGEVPNMLWARDVPNAVSTDAAVTVSLSDGQIFPFKSIAYTVDTAGYPSVAGWTFSAFKYIGYLPDYPSMNVGGITALSIGISIDYQGNQVGLDCSPSQLAALPATAGDQAAP